MAIGDWNTASALVTANPKLIDTGGALHLQSKRGYATVEWLLEQRANPNVLWAHWDADVISLHLAAAHGHADAVQLLLDAGADPRIRDTKDDGDALGGRSCAYVVLLLKCVHCAAVS